MFLSWLLFTTVCLSSLSFLLLFWITKELDTLLFFICLFCLKNLKVLMVFANNIEHKSRNTLLFSNKRKLDLKKENQGDLFIQSIIRRKALKNVM